MQRLHRFLQGLVSIRSHAAELVGFGLVAIGVHEIYPPAALIFAGAALVFVAQGLERRE